MSRRTLSVLLTAFALACLTGAPAWGVKIPSSPEEVKNLTDQELVELIEHFNAIHGPGVRDFWAAMGEAFSAGTPAEFEAEFPEFSAFLYDLGRNSSSGPSVIGSKQTAEDACGEDGLGDLFSKGFLEIAALAMSIVDVEHDKFVGVAAQQARESVRNDLKRSCPDCSEAEIDALEYLFIEETADAAMLANIPFSIPGNGQAQFIYRAYLWIECMRERCKRGLARGTFCNLFPAHPKCLLPPEDRDRCGDKFNPGLDPTPPPSNGSPVGGAPGSGSGSQGPGALFERAGMSCVGMSCDDETTVIARFPRLPEVPPGDRGAPRPPLPGDFVPDDPTEYCYGPCCGQGGGRRQDRGECWLDGVLVPCYLFF